MPVPDLQKTSNAKRQRGVVLFITLIALIAMTLAAFALMRSVDTGNVVAGNMAFKQGATNAGDAGTEAAATWLQGIAGTAPSFNDDPANGYYATTLDMDMTGNSTDPNRFLVNWDLNDCNGLVDALHCKNASPTTINAGSGNAVKYIIHRLCQNVGSPNAAGNNCATTATNIAGKSLGALNYSNQGGMKNVAQVEYYRITTRVKGPRNTVSYIETIIHF